ncbi:MAG TPA: nucleotide exchange factor GrpE [Candidatus Kryptonia bacterium]
MQDSRDQKYNGKKEAEESLNGNQEGSAKRGEFSDAADAEHEIQNDLDSLQKQLVDSEKLLGSYKDQLLRLAAEFENYRKRTELDKADFIKFSNERIIKDLLPILDDFGRALATGKKNSDLESFYKGIELIYQKFSKTLEEKGLRAIESVGKEFDVSYHDVLMQVPRPDVKPHTIVEEVERGYTLHGKVIKHAKVIIAAEVQDKTDSEEDE